MIAFFKQGFLNTNRNMGFVALLFMIDIALIAATGLMSLEWVSSNIGARFIVLHYNIYRIASAAPEFLKLAAEILIISGSISAAAGYISSGHMKKGVFFREGARRYFRILAATFIWFLAAVIPAFLALLVYMGYLSGAPAILQGSLAAAAIAFLVAMTVLFFFAPFVAVLEDKNTIVSIRASFAAAKRHFRPMLSFIGIYFLITLALYLAAALAIGAYLGAVESVTSSAKIGQLSKFSIEALFSFAARYVYVAGVFATILFYRSIKESDEKKV